MPLPPDMRTFPAVPDATYVDPAYQLTRVLRFDHTGAAADVSPEILATAIATGVGLVAVLMLLKKAYLRMRTEGTITSELDIYIQHLFREKGL